MIIGPGRDWFGLAGFDPGPARRGAGFLYLLEEVGSTSDFLLGRGEPGRGRLCRWDGWGWQAGERQVIQPPVTARPGSMVITRTQTAGRGRLGRRWVGDGGLMMSWTIDPAPDPPVAGLAVWTGLAAALALRELTGLDIGLKWPNDLRLGGRKLGGILLDLVVRGPCPRLVAGLGLNVGELPRALPSAVRDQAVALPRDAVRWRTLADLAGALLRRWDEDEPRFVAAGWREWGTAFASVDMLRGRRIVLESGGRRRTGTAEGIDHDGALLLRDADGVLAPILAGDVHILETGGG